MTSKQETIQLLEKLYSGREMTLTAYYAMRTAIGQMEVKK